MNCLLLHFTHFSTELSVTFSSICRNTLYITEISLFSVIDPEDTFIHFHDLLILYLLVYVSNISSQIHLSYCVESQCYFSNLLFLFMYCPSMVLLYRSQKKRKLYTNIANNSLICYFVIIFHRHIYNLLHFYNSSFPSKGK